MQEDKSFTIYFFRLCVFISILVSIYLNTLLISFFAAPDFAGILMNKFMVEKPEKIILILCIYLSGVLWIKNIFYWYKMDKSAKRLLLLISINWIYSPIYYIRTQW